MPEVAPVRRQIQGIGLKFVKPRAWIEDFLLKYAILGFVNFGSYPSRKEIKLDEVPKLVSGEATQDGQPQLRAPSRRWRQLLVQSIEGLRRRVVQHRGQC